MPVNHKMNHSTVKTGMNYCPVHGLGSPEQGMEQRQPWVSRVTITASVYVLGASPALTHCP